MTTACLAVLNTLRGQPVRFFVEIDANMCRGVEELNVAEPVAQGIMAVSRCMNQGVVHGGVRGGLVGEKVDGELAVG
jgi:hypothetical protein